MTVQSVNILNLPLDIRLKIFENLKEEGGVENIKAVTQTCRAFRDDIKALNLELEDVRLLYKITKADREKALDPRKVMVEGVEGDGIFSKDARISHVAQILGGHQEPWVSCGEVAQNSHRLPLYHWAPLTPFDNTNNFIRVPGPIGRREGEDTVFPTWEKVWFNGNQDQRSLEQSGLVPGHRYVCNFRAM